ncbi:MAG TPA: DUF2312 domain-containing protein [Alphaproteobacteria bacterium]|nr:DUF2312 domain-containing protein [Alphaproteobacteria bacterium]
MADVTSMMQSHGIHASTATQLRQFIESIEKLEEEKAQIQEQVKEVFAHAKSEGFDVKVMKQVIKLRKMKKEDLVEQEELLEVYKQALGMVFMGADED